MNTVRTKRKLDIYEFLFIVALTLKPFYLSKSGSMQLGDYVYMLLLGLFVINGKVYFPSKLERNWTLGFIILLCYQMVINLIWYFICLFQGYSFNLLRSIVFYVFNLLVCVTVFQMCVRVGYERLVRIYLIGTALSILVCLAGIAINWRGVGRVTGFFNNPNQLGYFSLLTMTIFVVFCNDAPKRITIIVLTVCTIMTVWSLSKAALIGSAVLLIAYSIISHDGRYTKGLLLSIIMIIIVSVVIYLVMYSESESLQQNYYVSKVRSQIFNMANENDSDLGTGRGYDRIREIGVFVVTGVGQGGYKRFTSISGKELHSTFASLIVNYGLIGLTGYAVLFSKAALSHKRWVFNLLAMSGILLYSITHNGIRSSILWTLLSMMLLRQNSEKAYERELFANRGYYIR